METRRLLLIDSDNEFKDLLNSQLAPYGFEVSAVSPDERDPLSRVTELSPAAVFIAVELPNKFGYSLCNKAKKGVAKEIPVILTTRSVAPSGFQSHRKLKAHADEYIDKREMTEQELLDKLNTLIGLGLEGSVPSAEGFEVEVDDEVEVEEIDISGDSGPIEMAAEGGTEDELDAPSGESLLDPNSEEIEFAFDSLTKTGNDNPTKTGTPPQGLGDQPLDLLEGATIQTDSGTFDNPDSSSAKTAVGEKKPGDVRAHLDKLKKDTAKPVVTPPAVARTPIPAPTPRAKTAPPVAAAVKPGPAVIPRTSPAVLPKSPRAQSAPPAAMIPDPEPTLDVSELEHQAKTVTRPPTSEAIDDLARQAQAQLERQRQDLEQEKKRSLEKVTQKHAQEIEALKQEHSEELSQVRAELNRAKEEQTFQLTAARQAETVKLNREHQAEISRLKEANEKALAELRKQLEDLQATSSAAEDQHGIELAELSEAHEEEKKQAIAAAVNAVEAQKSEIERRSSGEIAKLEAKVKEQVAEIEAATSEWQSSQTALEQAQGRISELEKALAQKEQEHRARSQELAQLNSEFNAKNNELSTAKTELAAREADLKSRMRELEERNGEIEATAKELSSRKAEISDLQDQIKDLETTLATTSQDLVSDKFSVGKAKKALAIALTLLDDCPAGASDSESDGDSPEN